jgi:hypothetical protein
MATSIGIRSSPSVIYYTILNDEGEAIGHSAPQTLNVPREALQGPVLAQFVRTTVLDILNEYEVNAACVKEADYHPQASGNPERYRIEGVIQEAVASSTAEHYISGDVNTLAPLIQISTSDFREIKSGTTWDAVEDPRWTSYKPGEIESILAAYVAFNSYD